MSFLKHILFITLIIALQNVYAVEYDNSAIDDEIISTGEAEEGADATVFDIPRINVGNTNTNKPNLESKLIKGNTAKIVALNKVTAKSKEIEFKIGESKYFGNIEIKVHKCFKNTDLYLPDSEILLTITEHKIDEDSAVIFQGWLIASSLSVSTFEHPVYEVFAKSCS